MSNANSLRNPYIQHLLRVFRIKYDRLEQLSASDNLDDSLEISAILRHLLMPSNHLADDIAQELGLQCSFPVPQEYETYKLAIFKADFTPKNNAVNHYKTNKFIDLICTDLDKKELTIRKLIETIANEGGGIHHIDDQDEYEKKIIVKLLETDYANLCFDVLKEISRITLTGLKHIRNVVDSKVVGLEQRKRTKQPERLVSKNKTSQIYFDGSTYLEGYHKIDLNKSGTLLFDFIPSKGEKEYPKVLLEIGSRKTEQKFSLVFKDKDTLAFRVYNSLKEFKECKLSYKRKVINFLFINYKKKEKGILFDCALFNNNKRQFEKLLIDPSWNFVEGKVIIGQDLKAKNGARFQWGNCGFIFWDYLIDKKDFMKILNDYFSNDLANVWLEEADVFGKSGSVTQMYNQAN